MSFDTNDPISKMILAEMRKKAAWTLEEHGIEPTKNRMDAWETAYLDHCNRCGSEPFWITDELMESL